MWSEGWARHCFGRTSPSNETRAVVDVRLARANASEGLPRVALRRCPLADGIAVTRVALLDQPDRAAVASSGQRAAGEAGTVGVPATSSWRFEQRYDAHGQLELTPAGVNSGGK